MGRGLRGIWAILLTFAAALAVVIFGLFAYGGGPDPFTSSVDRALHAVQFAGPRDQSDRDQGDPMSRQIITQVRDGGSR
ncbi:MAG: hypothetical protein J2P40_02535 [Candidatus Dormibacteraeota bacterium]|nr:hypothetical protein [Candidatus Dormibacteraeota bacterium]MBO0703802.1 hypothetical protein [Candidatus Dormibacteraeota bacterium]MBO0760130.1 hypothetical protein [Candidatus Dormibacteraeota bacterium]